MGYILGLSALSLLSVAWLPGAIILLIGTLIFLASLDFEFSAVEVLVVSSFVLALPFAAFIAGTFLDRFSLHSAGGNTLSMLATVLAFALMLGSNTSLEYFSLALELMTQTSGLSRLAIFISVTNTAFFCGSLIAFCLMTAQALLELPVAWFSSVSRVRLHGTMTAVRPLIVLLIFTFSFNLVIGLFIAELSPLKIFTGI